jgi:Ser/Thr protein kinase RdoA (MazF antagonist)
MTRMPSTGEAAVTTVGDIESIVTDAMLREAIEKTSRRRWVKEIERSRSAYATSSLLENVTVRLLDGTTRELMLKHLDPRARHERVTRIKPPFLFDTEREILVYREVLAPRKLGARFFGASAPGAEWAWLLVEKCPGVEMYQHGEIEAWQAAAKWIGQLHAAFPASAVRKLPVASRLIVYDRHLCLQWIERSLRFFANEAPTYRAALRWLAERFERVVDRLLDAPASLIHNEYYASNVLAGRTNGAWAVWPVDWEMTAIGPSVIDIAALTSGDWGERERDLILEGYRKGAGNNGLSPGDLTELLDYAQLYLAVQWLGWFGRRKAPPEHSRDWLGDAIQRAERLGM